MSFSFSAGGTRDEAVASLRAITGMSADGQRTRDLVLSFLQNAAPAGMDGTTIRYDVSAYGHHDDSGGSLPSLNVTLTGKYVPAETAKDTAAAE